MAGSLLRTRFARAVADGWQVIRGVAGERAYDDYLAHHRLHHPTTPAMTAREFWRWHTDRGDHDPGSRCC